VVEGEGVCDTARGLALAAVTSAHGSKSAGKSDWRPLAGRDILILPDNDAAGRQYAEDVRDILVGLDLLMPKDRDMVVAVGGEVWFVDMLALRAGYQTGTEMGNLSFGAGFKISDFQLDYTYTDHEDLDSSNRLSLAVGF